MDLQTALVWMDLFHQSIQENKDYLSELDTPIGDGDHGGNMARGMAAVVAELEAKAADLTSSSDVLKVVSMQLLSKVGGASGPLYGLAFMGMMKAQQADQSIAETVAAGLEMIQKRGKAEVGEKTMVDVWSGVVDALKAGELTAETVDHLVLSTKEIQATKGRASYVGERFIGYIDPGSFSSGLLFKALIAAGGVA
ncbi:dihydroxyacetone kinase subunit L [Streptococcus sp. X16XC17]|uniref:dihydroxyacetone kinase subunit DhaL n=1 Tax=unclassified Streptococcus TaxID=2608887 RepID=UPI00066FDF58|nr:MULTISPECIES: dihydroxyacetone kinase subunit DhaL [unclassified Streptococcus]TCD46618.1 dihydroxyacetone kinase subunit L [Streptococcus sp. X16XC17]